MSFQTFAPSLPRQTRPAPNPLPSANPGLLDDAEFVLRCVTSASKRRRYGLGNRSNSLALREIVARFLQCSG
ncbi:MAG TPA: hypothetical protein VGD81_02410 [Opitutaceae bacterium]